MSNPVPSDKLVDLKANSESLDTVINTDNDTVTRTGKVIKAIGPLVQQVDDARGSAILAINADVDAVDSARNSAISSINQAESDVQQELQDAIARTGYNFMGDFADGGTLESRVDAFRYDGEWYRWDGALPKVVPDGSTPTAEGGTGSGAWLSVGDAALRSLLDMRNLKKVFVSDYGLSEGIGNDSSNSTAVSQALQDASEYNFSEVIFPKGQYYLDGLISQDFNGNTLSIILDGVRLIKSGPYQDNIFSITNTHNVFVSGGEISGSDLCARGFLIENNEDDLRGVVVFDRTKLDGFYHTNAGLGNRAAGLLIRGGYRCVQFPSVEVKNVSGDPALSTGSIGSVAGRGIEVTPHPVTNRSPLVTLFENNSFDNIWLGESQEDDFEPIFHSISQSRPEQEQLSARMVVKNFFSRNHHKRAIKSQVHDTSIDGVKVVKDRLDNIPTSTEIGCQYGATEIKNLVFNYVSGTCIPGQGLVFVESCPFGELTESCIVQNVIVNADVPISIGRGVTYQNRRGTRLDSFLINGFKCNDNISVANVARFRTEGMIAGSPSINRISMSGVDCESSNLLEVSRTSSGNARILSFEYNAFVGDSAQISSKYSLINRSSTSLESIDKVNGSLVNQKERLVNDVLQLANGGSRVEPTNQESIRAVDGAIANRFNEYVGGLTEINQDQNLNVDFSTSSNSVSLIKVMVAFSSRSSSSANRQGSCEFVFSVKQGSPNLFYGLSVTHENRIPVEGISLTSKSGGFDLLVDNPSTEPDGTIWLSYKIDVLNTRGVCSIQEVSAL